jgi:hypothetical protein
VVIRLRISRPLVDGTARIEAKRHSDAASSRPRQVRSNRSETLQPPRRGPTEGIDNAPPVKITTDSTDIAAATRRP